MSRILLQFPLRIFVYTVNLLSLISQRKVIYLKSKYFSSNVQYAWFVINGRKIKKVCSFNNFIQSICIKACSGSSPYITSVMTVIVLVEVFLLYRKRFSDVSQRPFYLIGSTSCLHTNNRISKFWFIFLVLALNLSATISLSLHLSISEYKRCLPAFLNG